MACKGDDDGEMYQALFTGDGQWRSVILPFNKFLYTSRGVVVDQFQPLDFQKIVGLGFLQAERQDGEFCIQLESIRALSLARLSQEVRYDPDAFIPNQKELHDGQAEPTPDSPQAQYYPVLRY